METMAATKIGNLLKPLNTTTRLFAKCSKCGHGARFKDSFGEEKSWCKRCIDVAERKIRITPEGIERVIPQLVGLLYADARVEHLDQQVQDKLMALEYGQGVYLHGPVGSGKTYAMAALLRQFVCEGYECKQISFDDFCVKVRSTMSPAAKQTEVELVEPLKTIDKLFIDDLGLRSKRESDFAYITLYTLLDTRQKHRLPTFISSNKSIDQLGQQFDARIASRLQTALIIEMTGKDRRVQR